MDAQTDASSPPELNGASTACAECEQPTANPILSRAGASLCAGCVKAYYIACAGCGGLIPQDEALARSSGSGGPVCCADCFAKPAGETNTAAVDETLIESLISEYISLHAEEKRISERMEDEYRETREAVRAALRETETVTLSVVAARRK